MEVLHGDQFELSSNLKFDSPKYYEPDNPRENRYHRGYSWSLCRAM